MSRKEAKNIAHSVAVNTLAKVVDNPEWTLGMYLDANEEDAISDVTDELQKIIDRLAAKITEE